VLRYVGNSVGNSDINQIFARFRVLVCVVFICPSSHLFLLLSVAANDNLT
jgi:hypothetical protein